MFENARKFEAALTIVGKLHEAGHAAYLAGGCVRDLLLGREPSDYDVATSATPGVVLDMFPRTFAVGAHFGVVLVAPPHTASQAAEKLEPLQGLDFSRAAGGTETASASAAEGSQWENSPEITPLSATSKVLSADANGAKPTEVATFRSDGAYSDGRHPDAVRYTTSPEEDVKRRDFTINGLLLDVERLAPDTLAEAFDRSSIQTMRHAVLDFVGGLADLDAGIVRAIGRAEERFEEDRLRMLRAVRFAARFEFEMETGTKAAIRSLAHRMEAVSRERVRDELTKLLTEGHARRAFELLDETGLLQQVLPEVARMKGVEQPPQFHPEGDVWVHTLGLLGQLEEGCSATLAWGALLHDVGKPPTFRRAPDRIRFDGHVDVGVAIGAEICRRFRFSNEETHQILALIENHMRFADAQRMKASTLKRFFRLDDFEEHLALHKMDCLAGGGNLDHWEFVRERWNAMPEETVRPRPLITGRELIAAGYVPGAQFKEMLRIVEDAQLDGTIATEQDAIKLLQERFPLAT